MRHWPHRGRPPAGSLYARAVAQQVDNTVYTPHLLLDDGSLLLNIPDLQLPVPTISLDVPTVTEILRPLESTALAQVTAAAPTAAPGPAVTAILNSAVPFPFMVAPPSLSPTNGPISLATAPVATPAALVPHPEATSGPEPSTPTTRVQQALSTSTGVASRFTTVSVRPQTTSSLTRSSASTTSAIALFPSGGLTVSVVSTFLGSSTSSDSSIVTSSTTSTSLFSTTTSASPTTHTYTPSATASAVNEHPGGHTALFWAAVAIASLMGLITILLAVLFIFKALANHRTRQLWTDEFFNPKLSLPSDEDLSGGMEGTVPNFKSDARSVLPVPLVLATTSNLSNSGPYPPPDGEPERHPSLPSSLLACEFDGVHSLAPPQSLHIANHVRGDLSSDGHSMPATPNRLLPGPANGDAFGTPRTPRAPPFLRDSLRDGGLPVPWVTSDAAPDPAHHKSDLTTPLDHTHPDAIESTGPSRHASRLSYRWWEDNGRPTSTLPAEGWAATLRSNLYATLSAWSGGEAGSDPGAGASLTQQPSRARSARSKASEHYAGDGGGLYRSDSEASKYSQLSASLTNPFADTLSSAVVGQAPHPQLPFHGGSGIPQSASAMRQLHQPHMGLGLGVPPAQIIDHTDGSQDASGYPQPPPRAVSINSRRMQSTSFLEAPSPDPDLWGRGAGEERMSRVETWRVRNDHLDNLEPTRTLWPSGSRRLGERGGHLGIRNGSGPSISPQGGRGGEMSPLKKKLSASGRLPSGRPFLRKRGSSRDVEGGYASAD